MRPQSKTSSGGATGAVSAPNGPEIAAPRQIGIGGAAGVFLGHQTRSLVELLKGLQQPFQFRATRLKSEGATKRLCQTSTKDGALSLLIHTSQSVRSSARSWNEWRSDLVVAPFASSRRLFVQEATGNERAIRDGDRHSHFAPGAAVGRCSNVREQKQDLSILKQLSGLVRCSAALWPPRT